MSSRRGHQRERDLRAKLEIEDWWVSRAAGSLGDADLVCLRVGSEPMLVEVKSTAAGPFHSFGPAKRGALKAAAALAGAQAFLVWWPPRKEPKWLPESSWPS